MNGALRVFPDTGYVIAVLANMDPPAAGRLVDFIARRLPVHPRCGGLLSPAVPAAAPSRARASLWPGRLPRRSARHGEAALARRGRARPPKCTLVEALAQPGLAQQFRGSQDDS